MKHFSLTVERDRLHAGPHWATRLPDNSRECDECLGEGGFRIHPSEHSMRTVWRDCEQCDGSGFIQGDDE